MTNEEVKGHLGGECDAAGNDLVQNGNTTTGKLLTRPQTAAPSLKKSIHPRLQRAESSLAVIGTERSLFGKEDIRKRVQNLACNVLTPKQILADKTTKLKGLKFRVKSAVSRVGEIGGVEQQNIPIVGKELLLTKSLSSPNFNTPSNNGSPPSLPKDIKLEKKASSLVFPKKESKKSGLFISTEPITLATRPNSSLSISRKVRQDRPKTTSSLATGNRYRLASSKALSDEKNPLQSGDAAVDPCKDSGNDEDETPIVTSTGCSNQSEDDQSIGLKTSDLRLALNIDLPRLGQDKDKGSLSYRADQVSSQRSKGYDADDDAKETENIYENIKSILRSRQENKGSARTVRSTASSSLNPVLPLERELPPVRSPSALSHIQSPSSITQNYSPNLLLSQTKESKLSVQVSPNLHLKSSESLVVELKDVICESSPNSDEHEKTVSDDNVKTYKMATVEMYEKDFAKQSKLSITEEIKRQNARLEEKNSELRLKENTLSNNRHNANTEKDSEQRNDCDVSPEKGNVCGSPGFSYFQEQLKNMSNQPNYMGAKRLGSGPRTLHDTSRKGSGDACKKSQQHDKLGTEYKALGIRPLSDYTTGKSVLDNLFVAGGSCTLKSGEQAVSKAAENIATPAGVVSKVSLQHDVAKLDASENHTVCNENGVRVSLTYLKEKQGINPVGFRYRLDDYMSNGQQQSETKPKSALVGKQEYENKKRVRKSAPALSASQQSSSWSKVNNDVLDSDDDYSSQASSSSTPTAAFSGSELLYQNDGAHRSHGEELGGSDMPGYERDRQKLRDLEVGNRRPASRNKKMSVVDKVSYDRERDDLRTLNNSLPSKAPALRNGGPRNSLVRGEQIVSGRNGAVSNSNRESDDLIAMGTIWSPANNNNNSSSSNNNNNNGSSAAQTRSSSNTTTSNKSIPINSSTIIGSNGFPQQRKPISVSMSTTGRVGQYTAAGGRSQGTNKDSKEVEPKYSDPLSGAPASFQQRLMDLASLEAETIRWERTKKVKKKPKPDRDS